MMWSSGQLKILIKNPIGRSAFKIVTDKPTGKRYLGWPRHRWKDNIRMYLKRNIYQYEELGWIGSG